MDDRQGRQIRYLRLSLTGACQMRCAYCRPTWHRHDQSRSSLSPTQIEAVVRHLVHRHGVRKVRLTGGDPTARPDLLEIIDRLGCIRGLDDLAMTTNGLSLARHARRYVEAGLNRVNVSLDSLDPEQLEQITGIDAMDMVIAGIDESLAAGLTPLKINTVVMGNQNEGQLPGLVRFAAGRGVAIRFIELMPMGPLAAQWRERYVPAAEMKRLLSETGVVHWQSLEQGAGSATRYAATLDDGRCVEIGFITPMSCNFCAACNRLRLTSDGMIYPCLMDEPRGSYLPAVRPRFDAGHFDRLLEEALAAKAPEHPARGVAIMTTIGG